MNDDQIPPFQIGRASIGRGSRVYVIAEAGVNHDGDISVARELIHAAAHAEADAVKFQVFSADRLVTRSAPAAAYQKRRMHTETQYEMLARLELRHEQFAELASEAARCGIEFLATPFSIEDCEFLISIGVRAIKLASPDIINIPLLTVAAQSGLPVIASTGAAEFDEIADAVAHFGKPNAGPLALLHCISSYPARKEDANLAAIGTLAGAFRCHTGFSDHTESLVIGGYAAAAGARIIEKHLTLDRKRTGPDHAFSLEPHQMAEYIRNIRDMQILLGDGDIHLSPAQHEIRELARGSVVAACDIHPGEELTPAKLTIKRPGGGISPSKIAALLGRHAQTEIAEDTMIAWEAIA